MNTRERDRLTSRVYPNPDWFRQLRYWGGVVQERAVAAAVCPAVARWDLDRDVYAETVALLGYDPLAGAS